MLCSPLRTGELDPFTCGETDPFVDGGWNEFMYEVLDSVTIGGLHPFIVLIVYDGWWTDPVWINL